MRFTLAAPVEPPRPKGVSLTALAMAALALIHFAKGLLHLFAGTLAVPAVLEQLLICVGQSVVLICVWNYWKGQDWARIFVLLWSFLIAAKDISSLIDHDDTLVSLMSQPLRFFHAILAIFLLYFLNTHPVRGWFKKMSATAGGLIADHLVGKLCTAVEKNRDVPGEAWRLAFEHDAELTLNCPWRVVLDDNLAFASNAPTGAPASESPANELQPWQLLQNLRVKAVRVAPRTSDLFVSFEMGIELQSWSVDPRLLQWKFSDPTLTVIADSVGVTPQAIAARIAGEDPSGND